MSKPSITNCPNTFFRKVHSFNCMYSLNGAESCNSTFNNQQSTLLIRLLVCKYVITHYQVVIAVRSHLFPFRTEKLSSLAPMVLQCGRVGSRLLLSRASITKVVGAFLFSCGFYFLTQISQISQILLLVYLFSTALSLFPRK